MRWIERLERRLRPFAIPHLTNALVAFQAIVYIAMLASGEENSIRQQFSLVPAEVFAGEWWRVISFILVPPAQSPLWAFFYFYLFYLMGNALEGRWGSVGYNAFLGIGLAATAGFGLIAAAVAPQMIRPDMTLSNGFLYGSIFLAFAHLYPDFQLMLFFIIPVKIKWLAYLQWAGYAFVILFSGSILVSVAALTSVLNWFVFFGPDLVRRARASKRRMEQNAARFAEANRPTHVCTVCGITNLTHPDEQFRYCSKCEGAPAYCEEHLKNHEHITSSEPSAK